MGGQARGSKDQGPELAQLENGIAGPQPLVQSSFCNLESAASQQKRHGDMESGALADIQQEDSYLFSGNQGLILQLGQPRAGNTATPDGSGAVTSSPGF